MKINFVPLTVAATLALIGLAAFSVVPRFWVAVPFPAMIVFVVLWGLTTGTLVLQLGKHEWRI